MSKSYAALDFGPGIKLADVGGGSGHVAMSLSQLAHSPTGGGSEFITVVEPSESLRTLAQAKSIRTSPLDAVTWACSSDEVEVFDRILMKEMIHHVPSQETNTMWSSILQSRLSRGGRVCVITRPQTGIDYPFFARAVDVWEATVEPHSKVVNELREAGFENVTATLEAFPCEISLEQWLSMVRGRFWSTFDQFTDAELEEGCQEIITSLCSREGSSATQRSPQEPDDGKRIIHFEDRIFFITASKPR